MKRILVPLDGSALAEQVLPYVRALAPAMGVALRLLKVVPNISRNADVAAIDALAAMYGASDPLVTELEYQRRTLEQQRAVAEHYLDDRSRPLLSEGLDVAQQVIVGPPAEMIIEASHAADVKLVAMATHGYSGLKRWALGSITDKVAHATDTPMLIVRGDQLPPEHFAPRRIVVPLDGSALAKQALPLAAEIATHMNAELLLLHAVHMPSEAYNIQLTEWPQQDYTTLTDTIRKCAQDDLQAVISNLPETLKMTPVVAFGPAAETIVDEAELRHSDMIVMATHGYSGLKRWALGSVTDKVLHATKLPLLLVRARS